MTKAPVFVQTYYNVRYEKNVAHRVCDACYMAAENHFVKLRDKFVKDEALIDVGSSNLVSNSVILDASEETHQEERLPDNVVQVLKDNFNDVFNETLEKCNLTSHVERSLQMCGKKLEKVESKFSTSPGPQGRAQIW